MSLIQVFDVLEDLDVFSAPHCPDRAMIAVLFTEFGHDSEATIGVVLNLCSEACPESLPNDHCDEEDFFGSKLDDYGRHVMSDEEVIDFTRHMEQLEAAEESSLRLARELEEQYQQEGAKRRRIEEEDSRLARELQYEEQQSNSPVAAVRGPRPLMPGQELEVFDPLICAEKIDAPRLRALLADLASDRALRTLCGSFLHDVDCSNSEVRNVCCLAQRAGYADCIPTLVDYRDRREYWLGIISKAHGVTSDAAKRVVTLIMSGGRYHTWLRNFSGSGKPQSEVLSFATKIATEVAFLSRVLPRHADFSWTVAEREFLVQENAAKKRIVGSSGLEQQLLNRIIQWAEAQVLGSCTRRFIALAGKCAQRFSTGSCAKKGRDDETALRILVTPRH